jgi:hypothetical protein
MARFTPDLDQPEARRQVAPNRQWFNLGPIRSIGSPRILHGSRPLVKNEGICHTRAARL